MSFHERNEQIIRSKVQAVKIWSILLGSVNVLVGLLLVAFPVMFATKLGLTTPNSVVPAALSGIGVLVGAMGVSYFVALVPLKAGKIVWCVTALLHGMVAVSLVWLFEIEWLPSNWLPVAVLGLLVAVVQVAVLRAGWWTSMTKWHNYRVGRDSASHRQTLPI
ncbi:MAG: hypothetical protein WCP35_04940 [Verrucomicrobiota bacterium]